MSYPASKYTYRIEWSEEDQAHLARCLESPSLVTHGKSINGWVVDILQGKAPEYA